MWEKDIDLELILCAPILAVASDTPAWMLPATISREVDISGWDSVPVPSKSPELIGKMDLEEKNPSMSSICRLAMSIQKRPIKACVDTGAALTLLSKKTWNKLGLPSSDLVPTSVKLNAVGNQPIKVYGTSTLKFKLGQDDQEFEWSFVIADTKSISYDCLLGMDFLSSAGAAIDLAEKTITFRRETGVTPSYANVRYEASSITSLQMQTGTSDKGIPIYVHHDRTLYPGKGSPVEGIVQLGTDVTDDDYFFEPAPQPARGVCMADAIVRL